MYYISIFSRKSINYCEFEMQREWISNLYYAESIANGFKSSGVNQRSRKHQPHKKPPIKHKNVVRNNKYLKYVYIFSSKISDSEISDVDNDDSWFSKFFYMIKVVKSSATQPSALKKIEKQKCSRSCNIHSTLET